MTCMIIELHVARAKHRYRATTLIPNAPVPTTATQPYILTELSVAVFARHSVRNRYATNTRTPAQLNGIDRLSKVAQLVSPNRKPSLLPLRSITLRAIRAFGFISDSYSSVTACRRSGCVPVSAALPTGVPHFPWCFNRLANRPVPNLPL